MFHVRLDHRNFCGSPPPPPPPPKSGLGWIVCSTGLFCVLICAAVCLFQCLGTKLLCLLCSGYLCSLFSQKPPSSTSREVPLTSGRQLASTPERVARSQCVDLDRTPVPSDHNNSAKETSRQRAHNILVDKV